MIDNNSNLDNLPILISKRKAARILGIHYKTLDNWIQKDPSFPISNFNKKVISQKFIEWINKKFY